MNSNIILEKVQQHESELRYTSEIIDDLTTIWSKIQQLNYINKFDLLALKEVKIKIHLFFFEILFK